MAATNCFHSHLNRALGLRASALAALPLPVLPQDFPQTLRVKTQRFNALGTEGNVQTDSLRDRRTDDLYYSYAANKEWR